MSMQQVTPQQLFELLVHAIPAKHNVLVVSSPGRGKSSIVQQAAQHVGADILLSNPPLEDITAVAGLPWAQPGDKEASFLPIGNLAKALRATKLTVWDLEDLGQAPNLMQAGYMQLLLAREANGHKLPDCVTFVATSNMRTDRGGVGGILEPVKSRFKTIVELVSHLDQWCNWAVAHDVHPIVIAYLRWQPDAINQFNPTADMTNSPMERTWVAASDWLKLNMGKSIEAPAVAGAIGEGQAGQLMAFAEMFRLLPSIDGILKDPDNAQVPDQTNVLYAVSTAVASRVTEKNFDRAVRYATRLDEGGHGDFGALLVRDALRRKPTLAQTPTFVALMASPIGQLIGGI